MDQYPYSIPSSFPPYPEDVANKNGDKSQLQTHNPYYMNTSSTEAVFGFVPPGPQPPAVQPQPAVLPVVQPNGLISSLQTDVDAAGYGLYPDQDYTDQTHSVPPALPLDATVPEVATTIGLENAYNQQDYIREAISGDASVPVSYPAIPVPFEPPPPSVTQINQVQPLESEPFVDSGTSVSLSDGTVDDLGLEDVQASGKEFTAPSPIEPVPVEPADAVPTDVPWTSQTVSPSYPIEADTPAIPESDSIIAADVQCEGATQAFQPASLTENEASETIEPAAEAPQPESSLLETNCLPITEPTPLEGESIATETQSEVVPSSPSTGTKPDEPPQDSVGSCTKKKRRRIVQLNDDDDSDDEDGCDRLELLRSPEPPATEEEPINSCEPSVVDEKPNEDAEGNGASEKEDEDRPDSAASGEKNLAKSLLQNVVLIPAGDSEAHKRKKIRVLESDDEEDEQQNSVDDIGLLGEGAEDELNPAGLLMDENAEDGDYGAMEGIEMDKMEQIVTMDAPIIDPSRMIDEDDDDDEDEENDAASEREESDREPDADEQSDEASQEEEEDLGEEEEIVEEGVEMITAEDDAGEAIGIATDDEKELEEEVASDKGGSDEDGDRGSDQEEQASARSDEESEQEREQSESSKEDENQNDNDQSESRSVASPVDQQKDKQTKHGEGGTKSGSDDDVVCQNDLELNTISLLTDEEDDNMPPLPPPKKELPVVRIVNIKKELLDTRVIKREGQPKHHTSSSYLKQHHQQVQKKHEKKHKRKERVFDNNDPFGAWSSSSSEDEFIPNDIYFGTPDRVFTANTKIRCQRQKDINERYAKYGGKSGGKRRFSDDSDAEERRKRKQKLEQISRLNLPAYQQAQLQSLVKKKNKRKQDRFYDKSQDIPNDIYFGNVNVPLHVLYAFGSSSSDDERMDRHKPTTSWKPPPTASSGKHNKYQPTNRSYKSSSSSTYSHGKSTVSPSNDRSVQAMKEYLKIAGFKNVKFHKLWEGCKSNQERANAILRLMQEKGLEGEPTIAKCRELRKQLQMEREAKVLDTSLIIASGEGRITRRSARNPQNQAPTDSTDPNAPSTSGLSQVVPPESLETLNRIRSVIDPDSDGE
ncbi:uncharacterized protein LOC131429721 [Malaya genurostris]|uniref:uncharacterized protein LOC131429721 n=1 Tax=Malaya genurostris TaxID=325434 RepID=UPI0026F3940B|nr:uncharacterized protein LOC131429721 [Malaya genurostris]